MNLRGQKHVLVTAVTTKKIFIEGIYKDKEKRIKAYQYN
jgi:hypothetical protein